MHCHIDISKMASLSVKRSIAERIFGPENPKLVCVPGATENGRKVSLNEQDEEDENEDSFSTDGTNSANAEILLVVVPKM